MNNSIKMKESQVQEKDKEKGKAQRSKQEAYDMLMKDVELARRAILDGKPGRAIEISHKALMDYKEDLGGENSVLLLPGYLVQAEGYIAEGKLKKAEEYLIAAYWNYVQYSKPKDKQDDEVRQQDELSDEQNITFGGMLHKIFSKLYMAQKDYNKALDELKLAIYTDSVKHGPESINTSLEYYYIGLIFQHKKQIPEAESFYGKTSDIWYKFLKEYFKSPSSFYQEQLPDEVTTKEALHILKQIEEYFRRYQEDNRRLYLLAITRNFQAQALIYKLIKDDEKFRNYMGLAYQEFLTQRGENDRKTKKISEFVEMIKQREQLL